MSAFAKKIETLMREKEIGVVPHALLYPLSRVYGFAMRVRNTCYRANILPSEGLPCHVISVGNITAGGTGKTPVTMFIADFLRKSGKRVAILSRGYKGTNKGIGVVSDGRSVLMGPMEAGDEPYLMASKLAGVPVIVGADRIKTGRFALEKFSPNVLLLDDGFQHIRLKRDINILLMDSKEGFGNGYLLPRGILREPISSIGRADVAMVKGGEAPEKEAGLLLEYSVPAISFSYRPECLFEVGTGARKESGSLKGKKVFALAGIANPESFLSTLKEAGMIVVGSRFFPDHHRYTGADIEALKKEAAAAYAVITTEKDGVKLKGLSGLPIYALSIEVEIEEDKFRNFFGPILKGVF